MKVRRIHAQYVIKKLKIDMSKYRFTIYDIINGMNVELEHGKDNKLTNVTNNDILMTGKITLAHLFEYPDYYKRLSKLEKSADNYWKNRNKTK